MRKLLTFLIALGAVAFGSLAYSQGMLLLGAGSVSAPRLVGPPTFTFQVANNTSGAPTLTWTGPTSIGSDNFLAVPIFWQDSGQTFVSASFTINGSPVPASVADLGKTSLNSLHFYVFYAPVSTGVTSSSLSATWSSTIFNTSWGAFYSAQTSQMVSTTPVVVPVASATSGTVVSSGTFNVPAGGAVLSIAQLFGGSTSSPTFTSPNTPPVAPDASHATIWGSKSNASANASSQVSMTWTGALSGGEADIAAVVFR
jgi:hypothetical protein